MRSWSARKQRTVRIEYRDEGDIFSYFFLLHHHHLIVVVVVVVVVKGSKSSRGKINQFFPSHFLPAPIINLPSQKGASRRYSSKLSVAETPRER